MSDDIPQDQVEAVARELCKVSDEKWDAADFTETANGCDPEDAREGWRELAIAAIRVLTPMIAAVEMERCAALAQKEADFQYDMAQCVGREQEQSFLIYEYGQKIASRICADIRSVKGAVT